MNPWDSPLRVEGNSSIRGISRGSSEVTLRSSKGFILTHTWRGYPKITIIAFVPVSHILGLTLPKKDTKSRTGQFIPALARQLW